MRGVRRRTDQVLRPVDQVARRRLPAVEDRVRPVLGMNRRRRSLAQLRDRRQRVAEEIGRRIAALGAQISHEYAGKTPILVGILNGSFLFIADLMRALTIDCEVDFFKLSSYGAAKLSSGQVTELKRVDAKLEGRHVIVVEDIVEDER